MVAIYRAVYLVCAHPCFCSWSQQLLLLSGRLKFTLKHWLTVEMIDQSEVLYSKDPNQLIMSCLYQTDPGIFMQNYTIPLVILWKYQNIEDIKQIVGLSVFHL